MRLSLPLCVFSLLIACGGQQAKVSNPEEGATVQTPAATATFSKKVEAGSALDLCVVGDSVLVAVEKDDQGFVIEERTAVDGSLRKTWAHQGTRFQAMECGRVSAWVADENKLLEFSVKTSGMTHAFELPEGVSVASLEVGNNDDGTVFVADTAADTVYVYGVLPGTRNAPSFRKVHTAKGWSPITLRQTGGSLLVSTSNQGLQKIKLPAAETKDEAVAPIVPETVLHPVQGIMDITFDHHGYVLISTGDGPVRIDEHGKTAPRDLGMPIGHLSMQEDTRTLYGLTSEDHLTAWNYVAAIGEPTKAWAEADARKMRTFEKNGIMLGGGEYWPSHDDHECDYPGDVLWGFYPQKGVPYEGTPSVDTPTAAATACAEQAFDALSKWLDAPPKEFFDATQYPLISSRFYLWTNDYSKANTPFPKELRMNKFWYWQRTPAVAGRVPGYWKWESTVTQDGVCHIPDPAQIENYLTEKLAELKAADGGQD